MKYKLYEHRYTFNGHFAYAANCIEHAMDMLGHERVEDNPDLHIYNHTSRDTEIDMPEKYIIFKPTAPTGHHFQICDLGYANSSRITFEEPIEFEFRKVQDTEWNEIQQLIERRTNKWDSIDTSLVWDLDVPVKDDHILIIGQMPEDETVKGFGFGNHWDKMCQIIEKLKDRNLVIKLHPRINETSHLIKDLIGTIDKWKADGHQVLNGYISIHSVLPKTKVAIVENSTAGIECMMHDVPIISYGYPDYHWITKDLRILTKLNDYIDDMSWFKKDDSRKFLTWYIYDYLCYDIPSTVNRLQELI